ncbi:MAG TPA: glutathione S-transferase N-terminal domain-containing protein [Solirubrobacteraceae bacterium]|nr:glutathione S-transferase N-terminal domain-containing protein [Solirubrobacteraceae bacterium]
MHKLYVVHSSHPCETVKKALELKGIPYKTVELMIPTQAPLQKLRFGRGTVPGLKLDGGEKVINSRAILRRLDELVPDPPLLPADPDARAAVLEAERWGEEEMQALARRILWVALARCRGAIPTFQEASQLPRLPRPVVKLVAPGVIAIERAMNRASDDAVRADLQALPAQLDRVDDWILDGVLSGAQEPNAADLQIAASVRLLATIADVRPLLSGRPSEALAMALFPDFPGEVPAGALPGDWLPEPTA